MDAKHAELKRLMQEKLALAQSKNSSYSLRAFAMSCQMSPSSVSEFFNNKRTFSDKKIETILERLGLSPDQIASFDKKFTEKSVTLKTDVERLKLDTDLFFLASEPLYYSILSLVETKDFKYDIAQISARLGSTPQATQTALDRLLSLKLLTVVNHPRGKYLKLNTHHLDAMPSAPSSAIRLRHSINLDDAKKALENLPISERFFSSETLAVEKSKLPEMQELFYKFFDELHKISTTSQKDEVYEFCFHFFPRSKRD